MLSLKQTRPAVRGSRHFPTALLALFIRPEAAGDGTIHSLPARARYRFADREEGRQMTTAKPGLYANIRAKKERIAHGSKEHMRKASEPGGPSTEDFEKSKKTAKSKKTRK